MRGERIAAPVFALLLVVSVIGGGFAPAASPVGTVEAQAGDGSGGACGAGEWFLTLVTGTLLTTNCSTAEDVAEEWNETDAIETRNQIHSQAGQLAAGNEQLLTAQSNILTDSNTIAFSKGEGAAVETLANGGTLTEAKEAANQSIEDYYTVKQRNLVDRWNVAIETAITLQNRSETTSGVNNDFVTFGGPSDFKGSETSGFGITATKLNGTTSSSVAMVNGTNVLVKSPELYYNVDNGGWTGSDSGWFDNGELRTTPSDFDVIVKRLAVRPTENHTGTTLASFPAFWEAWSGTENTAEKTKEEVSVYIEESLGPAVENGTISATNYVSPATLAQEYAQEYGNGTSYIRATAIAAYSGMDAPDLNQTGSMTVTHDGTTYEGLLLSQQAPSGGWQSGEQYDPALLSGLQMFAVAGENSSVVELDGPFTVDSIQGTDGEEIQQATTFNVTYETSNASANYTELQQEIRALNEQIQERQAQATGGGSDVQSGTNPLDALASFLGMSAGAAVVVVIGAALLAARIYSP